MALQLISKNGKTSEIEFSLRGLLPTQLLFLRGSLKSQGPWLGGMEN